MPMAIIHRRGLADPVWPWEFAHVAFAVRGQASVVHTLAGTITSELHRPNIFRPVRAPDSKAFSSAGHSAAFAFDVLVPLAKLAVAVWLDVAIRQPSQPHPCLSET